MTLFFLSERIHSRIQREIKSCVFLACRDLQVLIDENKVAVGVEVLTCGLEACKSTADQERIQIKAAKEVILSTGSARTPQLLMLSGIGPKEELDRHQVCLLFLTSLFKNTIIFVYRGAKFTPALEHGLLEFGQQRKATLTYSLTGTR